MEEYIMANKYTSLAGLFKAIADAIREKAGTTEPIPAKEFSERIDAIGYDLFVSIATGEVVAIDSNEIDGLTSVCDYAFYYCGKLESVNLPSTTTDIGRYAFYECTNLKTINAPNVTSIDENAFEGCTNLTTINVPWAKGGGCGASIFLGWGENEETCGLALNATGGTGAACRWDDNHGNTDDPYEGGYNGTNGSATVSSFMSNRSTGLSNRTAVDGAIIFTRL